MSNLTEQWKKGELKTGWYYVLLFSNEEYIAFINGNWVVDDRLVEADIKEVLAPVPSYQENQQLKYLLREWVQFETEENPNDFTVISERMSELANKTKQAIGEK